MRVSATGASARDGARLYALRHFLKEKRARLCDQLTSSHQRALQVVTVSAKFLFHFMA
jgi:hypothetical protein